MAPRPVWWRALAAAGGLAWAAGALAAPPCDTTDGQLRPDAWVLRVANDIVARQDQNLTSGLQFKWVQAAGPDAIACSVDALRWAEGQLARLGPAHPEQVDTSLAVTQLLFTPQDAMRRDVIRDDRPYAGVALVTLGYSARRGDTLWATDLSLGWVGPAALGRETQNIAHKIFDSTKFEGWNNQLDNEPLFVLAHDRTWRQAPRRFGALEFDSFTHAGATLGNFLTRGELGFEWRLGQALPDDFGSDPLRLTSTRTAARTGVGPLAGWGWHVFISGNGRGVLHDITLDGNTFGDSQRVDRRFWVASAAVGFALRHGRWTFAFARGAQTRDFDNQLERPALGSFTLTTTLD